MSQHDPPGLPPPRSLLLALPHSGWPTILKSTCWVCGTNPSTRERKRAHLDSDRATLRFAHPRHMSGGRLIGNGRGSGGAKPKPYTPTPNPQPQHYHAAFSRGVRGGCSRCTCTLPTKIDPIRIFERCFRLYRRGPGIPYGFRRE
jgi:hypothetical protein